MVNINVGFTVMGVIAVLGNLQAVNCWFKSSNPKFPGTGYKIDQGWEKVTYGSNIKISDVENTVRLCLSGVHYSTGSKQKAITGSKDFTFSNTYFVVMPSKNEVFERGMGVQCGSTIRLKSSDNDHFLHSHKNYNSPLSGNQEVSGFSGQDSGDDWVIECLNPENSNKVTDGFWMREMPVKLKHKVTEKYLQVLTNKGYGHPISGHYEASCGSGSDKSSLFIATEGFFFNFQK
ncbi:Stromal cell-derived factor 2 [Smittium culicis]|uniref:Stromal cell-derived factor 2 n=1 Tax=Smittium culicis TaxID=133412 RepID=A0A1R1XCJ3_9FUNG|nr:Stromal cell-derived factor 2 [Smittium culicis]